MPKDRAEAVISQDLRGTQFSPPAPLPPSPSWLHRWRPLPKLVGLGALMAAFAQVQRLALLPLAWALLALLWALSGVPLSRGLKRLAAPGALLIALVALLPLVMGNTILWQWGSLALRWEGLEKALYVVGRSLALLALATLLLETTPLLELLAALRALGIPDLLLELAWLTQRYLQEISAQWQQMQRAAWLRGWQPRGSLWRPGPALRQDLPFLAAGVATLLVRSYERSERVYQALRLRGYGRAPLVPTAAGGDPCSWAASGLAVAVALGLVWVQLGG
ncbi:cobalt ECF transporter T component CbiQ [Synechococcus sp. H55.11]|uniref:cobalt ECF transporter T component CbiQ n=1 Tax=unclassified Synechococcus TaxID=2626047 RepID=UPI0039C0FA1A